MKTALIACKTIKKEIETILNQYSIHFDSIFYVASGLHNSTFRLQEAVKKEMEKLERLDVDRVLLCFGLCGNMVDGLETGDYETILPKTDDCITLLLGSGQRRKTLDERKRGYYLTRGWLSGEANLHKEYKDAVEMYGRKAADEIYRQIFDGYTCLSLIDTGQGDYEEFFAEGKEIAKDFGLQPWKVRGEMDWLTRYLLQDIAGLKKKDRIVIYPPFSRMSWKDFIEDK